MSRTFNMGGGDGLMAMDAIKIAAQVCKEVASLVIVHLENSGNLDRDLDVLKEHACTVSELMLQVNPGESAGAVMEVLIDYIRGQLEEAEREIDNVISVRPRNGPFLTKHSHAIESPIDTINRKLQKYIELLQTAMAMRGDDLEDAPANSAALKQVRALAEMVQDGNEDEVRMSLRAMEQSLDSIDEGAEVGPVMSNGKGKIVDGMDLYATETKLNPLFQDAEPDIAPLMTLMNGLKSAAPGSSIKIPELAPERHPDVAALPTRSVLVPKLVKFGVPEGKQNCEAFVMLPTANSGSAIELMGADVTVHGDSAVLEVPKGVHVLVSGNVTFDDVSFTGQIAGVVLQCTGQITFNNCKFESCGILAAWGAQVQLTNCKFSGCAVAVCASSHGTNVFLDDCQCQGCGQDMAVEGGAKVVSRRCQSKDTKLTSSCAVRGGVLHLDQFRLRGCAQHGMLADGVGSSVEGVGCSMHNCTGSAGVAICGATVSLEGGKFHGKHGLRCVMHGTRVSAKTCMFSGSEAGMLVADGASLEINSCTVKGSGNGLVASGLKTKASATNGCQFLDNARGVLVEEGAHVKIQGCKILRTQHSAILARGTESAVYVDDCQLEDAATNGVSVSSGAHVILVKCSIMRCRSDYVVRVAGEGSTVEASDCDLLDNCRGVLVWERSTARLKDCRIGSTTEFSGLQVQHAGSLVNAQGCTFENSSAHGVTVSVGARVMLTSCKVTGAKSGCALGASGEGAIAEARSCEFRENRRGVLAQKGANITLLKCNVLGTAEHSGLDARGVGTLVTAEGCEIERASTNGVAVFRGASAILTDCTITKSSTSCAIGVSGEGSNVKATDCSLRDNNQGVLAEAGADMALLRCVVTGTAEYSGLDARGVATKLKAEGCRVENAATNGVVVFAGAEATLRACHVLSARAGCGIRVEGEGSYASLYGCNFEGNRDGKVKAASKGRIEEL